MRHVVAVAVAAWLVPFPALAQSSPDFSGRWTMDPARSVSAVQNEPVHSKSLVIQQASDHVTIERTTDGRTFTTKYRAGAAGSPLGGGGAEFHGIWYFDGMRLVTETAGNVSDKTVRTREVYTMTGGELTVETLAVVEHGYSLRGAKNYASGKDVYKKTPH